MICEAQFKIFVSSCLILETPQVCILLPKFETVWLYLLLECSRWTENIGTSCYISDEMAPGCHYTIETEFRNKYESLCAPWGGKEGTESSSRLQTFLLKRNDHSNGVQTL